LTTLPECAYPTGGRLQLMSRYFVQYSACQKMPNKSHIKHMKKSPRVTFKMLRIAEGDWQIVAECPGTETHYIKGLKSKEDVDEWLAGTRRVSARKDTRNDHIGVGARGLNWSFHEFYGASLQAFLP
jgi:hypothetical protein